MVEDHVSDGKRIAELLSSELTGLDVGPLSAVSVTDADPAVEPTADGALAYRISHEGLVVGSVFVTPSAASVAFEEDPVESVDLASAVEDVGHPGLSLVDDPGDGEVPVRVDVDNGAAVKAAVDVLRAVLGEDGQSGRK